MKKIKIRLYDTFTNQLLTGNVTAVVTRAEELTLQEMQGIAREMHVPATCFAQKRSKGEFEVRYFTPAQEIDMCGHGVIGTFMALAEEGRLRAPEDDRLVVKQITRSGAVPVEVLFVNQKPIYAMMVQRPPFYEMVKVERAELADYLSLPESALHDGLPIEVVSTSLRHLFVPIRTLDALKSAKPFAGALAEVSKKLNVVTVCAFTFETVSKSSHVHCRDFCPGLGTHEEAASGTTNAALACYMIKNRVVDPNPSGVTTIIGEQGHILGRPSSIRTQMLTQGMKVTKVRVGGTAVKSMSGVIIIP